MAVKPSPRRTILEDPKTQTCGVAWLLAYYGGRIQ
jgi:hypothetical protein